jgi:hypothetical protein
LIRPSRISQWKLYYLADTLRTNETSPFFAIGLLLCVFK